MVHTHKLRKQIISICHLMHQRGLTCATDGNVSARFFDDTILITPSGFNKGLIEAEDLIITDMKGKRVAGDGKPSSEIAMHLEVYRERPDINAVVHGHPATCIAFSVADKSLIEHILPEVVISLGVIPTAPYATPTTQEVPDSVRKLIRTHNALILDRHGSLTIGKTVIEAYNNLEKIEHAAQVIYMAHTLGRVKELEAGQIAALEGVAKKLGLRRGESY